jgi:hypothetical protein
MRLGRYEEALEGLRRFRSLPAMLPQAPNADLEQKVFAMGASLELAILSRMGRFDRALERLAVMADRLVAFDEQLSTMRKAALRFQAAWVCLGAGRPDEALRWCRELLNGRGVEAHPEIHALGRLLHLLLLLETGKGDVLKYDLRNVERYLRSHGRDHGVERALVRFIRQCLKCGARLDGQAAAQLQESLLGLEGDPLEQAAFDHFDPGCYAASRATGTPMARVAADRAAARNTGPGRHAA